MKRIILSLICGVLVLGIATGCGNEINKENSNNSNSEEIIYYDQSRDLKDTYTFKEAVSKFAFKVSENTLIFEENDKATFEAVTNVLTIHDELDNFQFEYEQEIYTSLGQIWVGESSATTLDEFISNFKTGKLSEKTTWTVEDVNIIESTDEYVFASWANNAFTTSYEYYFAKKIGNKVYYAYNTSLITYSDVKISLLLNQFKDFFTCLKEDDGKEPYIYDKIINVPVVLNKQIKDVNYIAGVINVNGNDYLDGSVSFTNNDADYINIEYGADKHYDKIDWSRDLDKNIKYMREDSKNVYGIKDNNNVQIIEITNYSDDEINNLDEIDKFFDEYLIDK